MSTILEALKRSEQERKLNDIPTLSDMRAPQESSRWPLVGFIIVVFLLLALIAFNWFSGRGFLGQGSPEQAVSSTSVTTTNEIVNDDAESNSQVIDVVVNVVSYSERVEQRFAMIDGKLFREGEFVRGGLKVEEIRRDAVVLNSRGERIVRKP